jgi:hypothetical protein
MKRTLILFFVISLALTYTNSHATVVPPGVIKDVHKEVKSELLVPTPDPAAPIFNVCYAQQVYTDCGTFQYDLCFASEEAVPPMEVFLAIIDQIDASIRATCT